MDAVWHWQYYIKASVVVADIMQREHTKCPYLRATVEIGSSRATNRYILLVSTVFTVSTVFVMSAEGEATFQYPVLVFLVANLVQILL